MRVTTGRTVFEAGGDGLEVACPSCKHRIDEATDKWMSAVRAWYEGDDRAAFSCPGCRRKASLNDWDGPWPWAFGHIGFTFWNWPPLKESFVSEVAKALGHRTRLVRGHI